MLIWSRVVSGVRGPEVLLFADVLCIQVAHTSYIQNTLCNHYKSTIFSISSAEVVKYQCPENKSLMFLKAILPFPSCFTNIDTTLCCQSCRWWSYLKLDSNKTSLWRSFPRFSYSWLYIRDKATACVVGWCQTLWDLSEPHIGMVDLKQLIWYAYSIIILSRNYSALNAGLMLNIILCSAHFLEMS